ncbi:MAG: insulinase family protein [Pseudomonadales bacterium]|nr:insulinase family protein [Pseudomonadales bacterium]
MYIKKSLACIAVLCLVFLSACSQISDDPVVVEKSPSDKKTYEYLKLDNGLKVLLISDEDAEFSAASLDVFVGSGSDPENRAGLAHFLEHMLFLGTKKYPDAAEYQAFIKANAGTHNAYTSFEHTNYFFDIKASALEPTLDRFAQFFIAPTLDAKYIEREKHAVDSEYRARYKNDARRNLDVFKTQINPQHPFTKFSVGSVASLSDGDGHNIKDDLKAFYKQWYSAQNMSLVVLGKESLPELKQMVKQMFSAVPGFSVQNNEIDVPLFEAGALPRWLTITPEKNLRELSLVFPVADQTAFYKSKPMMAIGHVLGHEGKGSLFSYLKQKNWADSLSAGSALNYQGGSTFALNIGLTQAGLDHQQEVVVAVFQAINRLKQQGVPEWVVDEIASINQLGFTYKEQSNPVHYVMGLSNALHYYPAAKVLSAEYLIDEYRPDLIADILASLSLNNVMISVVANGFTNTQTSPFYQTPYAQGNLPTRLLDDIKTAGVNDAIVLPQPNHLLPENLQLMVVKKPLQKPEKILQKPGLELWYKPLAKFQLPKSSAYYSVQSASMNADVHSAVLTSVYISLLNDSLNEWVYPAQMAGLSYGLYPHSRGLTLKLSGFSDKQPQLLAQLTQRMLSAEFTEVQFQRVKSELQRRLLNAEKLPPYQKIMANWQVQMNLKKWHASEKLEQLNGITLEHVNTWASTIWSDVYIKAMSNGNVDRAVAIQMAEGFQLALGSVQPNNHVQPAIEVLKLPPQAFYTQVTSQHADSAYLLYWQGENNDLATQANWLVLGKTLEAAYFDQLRTQQQLGYIVFANYYPQLTVPGLTFIVQSPKASVLDIDKSTKAFIVRAQKTAAAMPEQLFSQYKAALVQKLLESPKKLSQESNAYWYELALGDTGFDRKQKLADIIAGLSLLDWQSAVASYYKAFPQRTYLLGTDTYKALQSSTKGLQLIELNTLPEGAGRYIYR